MITIKRSLNNPILEPNKDNLWEAVASFNGCPLKEKGTYHLVYRAVSDTQVHFGMYMNYSSIGYAVSKDGINYTDRKQLIKPDSDFDRFGCEDPRITKIDNKYYILYTALSTFPFTPDGIKIGVAVSKSLNSIGEKHPVTPFNSKAMSLFPEKINGKYAAILTVNTDKPPAKICVAYFDFLDQLWSKEYWDKWYQNLDLNLIPLQRSLSDHVEAGAPPVKTKFGWLLIYCYIKNYLSSPKVFGIEAVLVAPNNPQYIIGRTKRPIMVPTQDYELYGHVPNVIFPTGALVENQNLNIYYGAADTTVCVASCKLNELMADILADTNISVLNTNFIKLTRSENNPLIKPIETHEWESKFTLNPAAIYLGNKFHILYRAQGEEGVSTIGYASSDGETINERLEKPIYVPRESFEIKKSPGFSGCEDPRVTLIDDRIYMCYTAYDGVNPTRVALTSIKPDDFLNKRWHWEKPILISPPGIDDKNSCIFPEKVNGKYVILHRINPCIWIDFVDSLKFDKNQWIKGDVLLTPREDKWDDHKIGIGPPPILTKDGWLLIYHGLSKQDNKYRLGVVLLDSNDPSRVRARLDYSILEPDKPYENKGLRPGTVFACGAVVVNGVIYVYYGAGDDVVCVAKVSLEKLLNEIKEQYNLQMIFRHSIF